MFESETTDVIRKRMLQRVSPAIDKREGSIIHDATAPAAIELELLYATLDFFLKATFADTAPREFLVERAKERGMEPYPASAAVVKVVAVPSSVSLPIGSRFSCDDVNYAVTKNWRLRGNMKLPVKLPERSGTSRKAILFRLILSPVCRLFPLRISWFPVKTKKKRRHSGRDTWHPSTVSPTVGTLRIIEKK